MSYYRSRMFDKASLYGDRHPLPNVRVKHEYSPPPPGREYLSPPARDYPSPGSVYTPSPPHYSYSPPMPHGDGEVSRNLHRWYGENEHARRYGCDVGGRSHTKMVLNVSTSESMGMPLDPTVTVKVEPLGSPSDLSNMSTDMSPCGSYTAETTSIKQLKKRKGHGTAGKSIEEELCLICGDRASGYHYNALSCEGCKGFFRRSITKVSAYKCKSNNDCEMDMWMRRRCQACRLRRCREVGMKEECLLSEEQCKARDVRRKARAPIKKEPVPEKVTKATADSSECEEFLPENPLEHLADEYRQLLERVVTYQDEYDVPSEDDIQQITQIRISDLGRPTDLSEVIYKSMAEMTILVTHLVVEFAKRLPGFNLLNKEDQILLLKSSASEVMILRTARRYDIETDTIVFADGTPYTRENMRFGGLGDWVDEMFAFCKSMGLMSVDNAEYALLTAICIFSERPGMIEGHKVEDVQSMYTTTLHAYDKLRRKRSSQHFAKLLVKLADLRTLSSSHKDILFSLKVEKGPLPPLLSEFFDVV